MSKKVCPDCGGRVIYCGPTPSDPVGKWMCMAHDHPGKSIADRLVTAIALEAYHPGPSVTCEVCGAEMDGRSDKKTCSGRCRVALYRRLRKASDKYDE